MVAFAEAFFAGETDGHPPGEFLHVWEFYRELCSFGIHKVVPTQIKIWADLTGIFLTPSEASLIARIQQAYWLSKDPRRRNNRRFARVSEISGAKVVSAKSPQPAAVAPRTKIKSRVKK